MILFGHLGLTYAAAAAADKSGLQEKLKKLNKHIDYRLVFIGAVLPDLIDKLTIYMLGDGSIHSGRIFAHSILFVLIMTAAGLLIWKKAKTPWLLTLAACSLIHQLLDSMWLYPGTMLWPFYDISMLQPGEDLLGALSKIISQDFNYVSILSIRDALKNPFIGIPEIIGLVISGNLFIRLALKKKLKTFLKTGKSGL